MKLAMTLFALGLAASAQATVKSGVKIRWTGDRPLPAQAGHELAGQLEIVAPRPGKLENLQIGGTGWSLRDTDAPRSFVMGRGERRVVRFHAVPEDPSQPLTVRATFDGVPVERSARLDARSLEKRHLRYQNASGPTLSGFRGKASPSKAEGTQAQQLAFMGDFRYTRADGVVLGADHIKIKVWDDDPISDELIWQGETDANGHFEGAVSWDDCDISGCDDPDVYVEVIASTDACDLQEDSLLEETYSWESPVINDFTGTFIDFGTMWPGTSEDGVIQVFNTVTRAHRFAANRGGMNADPVDVQYPDGATNSYYNDFYQELHIVSGHEWNEIVATHEFGHYLNDVFGNLLDTDYDNGFCDNPPDGPPGHCLWCPEHVGEGWQEGWGDFFAQVVVENYLSDYGQTPYAVGHDIGIYGVDSLAACRDHDPDIQFYPDGRTEGYVMALLRDIWDGANDDHNADPAPDCYKDALSLGVDEIFTVFRDDDPTDIGMFINSFRARYPQYDMDLWSTCMNVGSSFGFPLPDPAVVSQPVSCAAARTGETYVIQVTGNGSLLQYQWRFNGANLSNTALMSGVTTPTLTLSPLLTTMSGVYDCVVSTCDGTKSVTSNQTRLTVFDAVPARPHLTWGENQAAQCGNGGNTFEVPPGSYTGLTNVVQAEGGRSYSIALRADGTVYTWGRTTFGELGNGLQTSNVMSPAPINLSNVIQVAAGNTHALALRRDGTIKSWGYNFYGQLGNGTQGDSLRPSNTLFPGCFVAISGGYSHTLALRSDGTVWACGYGGLGSIGDGGTTGIHTTPAQVPGLTNVVAIRAAGYTSYALKSDGTVWAWGYNVFGEIGDGTTTQRNSPVQVAGLTNIRAIAASYYNGYAIRSTGEVYAWGRGDMGAIGNGSFAGQLSPVLIPGLTNPWKIVTGDAGWAMALQYDNTLRAWGYNFDNVLHTGATDGTNQNAHQPVLGIIAANNVGAGYGTVHVMGQISGATAVEPGAAPLQLALRVAPTPARSSVSLAFDLPTDGRVSMAIYDVAGRLVRSIVRESRPAGKHVVTWDGFSGSGQRISAGVFVAKLEADGKVLTRRIVLVP